MLSLAFKHQSPIRCLFQEARFYYLFRLASCPTYVGYFLVQTSNEATYPIVSFFVMLTANFLSFFNILSLSSLSAYLTRSSYLHTILSTNLLSAINIIIWMTCGSSFIVLLYIHHLLFYTNLEC